MIYLAYASAWISTACAVGYAIHATGRMSPLWFMLIPACIEMHTKNNSGENNK